MYCFHFHITICRQGIVICDFFFSAFLNEMVKTRFASKKTSRAISSKRLTKEDVLGKASKSTKNLDRCKIWIQQQKKEKLKYQPDELNSDNSDDESPNIRLESITVVYSI